MRLVRSKLRSVGRQGHAQAEGGAEGAEADIVLFHHFEADARNMGERAECAVGDGDDGNGLLGGGPCDFYGGG